MQQATVTPLRSPVASARIDSTGYMGDLVAWRFAHGNEKSFKAPRDKVRVIFEEAGFGKCLDDRLSEPTAALGEAVRAGKFGHGFFAQEFAKKNGDAKAAIGVYFRGESMGEHGDDMICGARLRVENDVIVVRAPEGGVQSGADPDKVRRCEEIAADIAKQANLRLTFTFSQELSNAIVSAGRQCLWAPFRRAGGVYWVHSTHAPRVRALLDGLEALGGFWATLQPLYGDADGRTMRNIRGAATAALEAEIDELVEELKKAQDKGMKDKALEARRIRCQELVIQASLYRDVLETSHAAIVQRVDELSHQFGALLNLDEMPSVFNTDDL